MFLFKVAEPNEALIISGLRAHAGPEGDEREGDEDQEVGLDAALRHLDRFCTRRRNSSPRRSKFSNWS